jgi:hypothetical protein
VSGFALRFAAEVAFLALLALAVGLAELSTEWIVVVMVIGWLLVALVELLAWRSETGADDAPPSVEAEQVAGEATSWDLEEILAPVPEDEP